MFGGNFEDRIESKLVKLADPGATAVVICLVDGEKNRNVESAQTFRNLAIARDHPFAPIDQEHEDIRSSQCPESVLNDELVQGVGREPEQAACVRQRERPVSPFGRGGQGIAGRASDWGDN